MLLPELIRVLGPDASLTLQTRSQIAHWTGVVGDVAGALRQYQELLPDLVRVVGPDHPDTLSTRVFNAGCIGVAGDVAGALREYQELLPDLVRVVGPDHPDTLSTRYLIALWSEVLAADTAPNGTGEAVDPGNAKPLSG